MRHRARRAAALVSSLLLAAAGLLTVSAQPAGAGYANDQNQLAAAFYNVTPYPMTLVGYDSSYGWYTPPATIQPGSGAVYVLAGSGVLSGGICIGTWKNSYHAWMTYRVDVLGGPPEYLTMAIAGTRSQSAAGCGDFAPAGDQYPALTLYNTTSMPVYPWDPASGQPPGPLTAKPQVTNQYNTPQLFDQTIGVQGDWTVDANSPLGRGFDQLLNELCSTATDACEFTQTGDLTWGIGTPTGQGADTNCPDSPKGPAYLTLGYEAASTASLSVGAGVELGTEANLFDIIKSKITVSVEAEHEWAQTDSFSRHAKVYAPRGYTGALWTAPTIGTVTGTLKFRTPTSTFTVLNFRQVRSGVTRDKLTPPYNVMALARPATAAEIAKVCGDPTARAAGPSPAAPRPTLVPGRGIGSLRLGAARDTRLLGKPELKAPRSNRSATANDCTLADTRCRMVAGRGGTWVYDDGTAVVFDGDHRVTALIHTGGSRTSRGIGVGSGLHAVREAYPAASCDGLIGATSCVLRTTDATAPVDTMFHLIEQKGRTVVDKVIIHRVDTSRGGWTA